MLVHSGKEAKMLIRVGTRNTYYSRPLLRCLEMVKDECGFSMEWSDDIPPYTIWVGKKLIAYIDIADGFELRSGYKKIIDKFDCKVIFKYHYDSTYDYKEYSNRLVPCGLYRWWRNTGFDKDNLLARERSVDVVALMKWWNRATPKDSKKSWAVARRVLVFQAEELQKMGYNTKAGRKIGTLPYERLLLDTKIGFLWSASAYLGWKIPEFTQQGVVMITQSLGRNYPLVNDTIFEDGVHCVFCDDPNLFGQVAIELLNDKERLEYLRRNVVDLWEKKLTPREVGKWLYRKINE